ncbi:histidine kinase [Streptomyces bambusae]|uniref:sensor histidine kinase n=1 Tax=Streptomyces bambusae TaxID=1550616 RepID=UPI001CFF713E|nr:histidine kinase [Streptomyces bambusae]MCB5169662.1 histidine kinase [Streptomyces bambusae]
MSKLTGWWKNRGQAAKVELYTRWSFLFFAVIELTLVVPAPFVDVERIPIPLATALALVATLQSVLCGVVCGKALNWVLERGPRPVKAAGALIGVTAAAVIALLVLRGTGEIGRVPNATTGPTLVGGMVCFGVGALVLVLRRVREMALAVPVSGLVTAVAALAAGVPGAESVGYGVGVLLGSALLAFTCGFSAWLVRTVWELDRSRELQARLAVAEERLRFGRDLHDVMGRNLAVIALKSELAVQLARRERPEAVEQMIEVQRIAQESQREVRDVVRGYREADLVVELEGARGVLTAAGIDCRVDVPADTELPAEIQSAFGWVVREAATNILRHGDARSCTIGLSGSAGDSLTLVVENDGVPSGPPAGGSGSGLAGLRERLAVLDGTLEAGPLPGGRFRLRAEIPAQGAAA